MKVRLLKAEFNTAVKYVTKEGFTNNFPITFDFEGRDTLLVVVGFKVQKGTYTVETVEGMPCVVFKEDLKLDIGVTIQRRTHGEVPHTYQYTGNAQGGSEFNAATIDENFNHLYRVVEEVNEGFELNLDGLHRLEDKFNDVTDGFEEVKEIALGADAKSESAIKTANRADTKADGAVVTATQALDIAKDADNKSDQAITKSDDAIRIANEAKVQATNAEKDSEEAVTIAGSASESAGIALNQSNTAVADAKHAVEVAKGIDGKATEALTNSEEAKAEVSVATTTANEAKVIAQGIEGKADTAIATSNEAERIAQEALDKAQEGGMTEAELVSKSVGSDKWMREGAYGLGGLKSLPQYTANTCQPSGFYYSANTSPVKGSFFIDLKHSSTQAGFRLSNLHYSDEFYLSAGNSRGEPLSFRPSCLIMHDKNTRTDKNNVLHRGTGTPINTLNVSDMSDTVVNRDDLTVTSGAVYRAIEGIPKPDMSEYRKLDNNEFEGFMQVKAESDAGTGVSLQDMDGTVRGQVVATDQGLQLTQYPVVGGLQTFTFPSEGGEVATTSYVDDKIVDIDTSNLVTKDDITNELGDSTELVASQALVSSHGLGYGQSWVDVTSERDARTTYTNTTDRTIHVLISTNCNTASDFEINGVSITVHDGSGGLSIISAPIPSGGTYGLAGQSNRDGFKWLELR